MANVDRTPLAASAADRGDRLRPPRTFHARVVLLRLADIMERIARELPEGAGRTLLDVGCGNAPYRQVFERRGWRHVGADLPGAPHAQIELGPDGELPPHAGRHDLVLSSQVLEHVLDPAVALQRLRDALTASGTLVLSTHGVWPYHPDPHDRWRWTSEGLRVQLQRAGLRVDALHGVLGPTATGLQLVTTSLASRLGGGVVSRAWCALMQPIVGAADVLDGDARREADAAVYVAVARRDGEDAAP